MDRSRCSHRFGSHLWIIAKGRFCPGARVFLSVKPSFHMRPLPDTCVKLSSPEGKLLFREALSLGGMEGYFSLAENFITQAEPSYCSVSTLTMVLNSMRSSPLSASNPRSTAYLSEPQLRCKLEDVEKHGMTLAEFVALAQQHGARSACPHTLPPCLPPATTLP